MNLTGKERLRAQQESNRRLNVYDPDTGIYSIYNGEVVTYDSITGKYTTLDGKIIDLVEETK